MRKFLCDCLCAVVFFTILITPLEKWSSKVQNKYTYKKHYIEEHAGDISLLLLGNSYFENSLNPHELGDSVFDFAISGRWIYYDAIFAQKYIPSMTNLHTVVYPVSYFHSQMGSYHYNRENIGIGDKENYIFQYAKYMGVDYDRFPQNLLAHSSLLKGKIVKEEFKYNVWVDSIGYEGLVGQDDDWRMSHNINPKDLEGDHSRYILEYENYLTTIAEVCYENSVRFIMVIPPLHDAYLQNTTTEKWDNVISMVKNVQNKCPVDFFDYHDDCEFRTDSIWFNCSHLNKDGATMLAKRLRIDAQLP